MRLPPLIPVRQALPGRALPDVPCAVRGELERSCLLRGVKPGALVGVAVGSRGIPGLANIVSVVVSELRVAGARPVIIPAMGSHGGATPAGQIEVLASLGVTADFVGAPIRASMAVKHLGDTPAGTPILFSQTAMGCEGGVILVNRIKHHSDFRGPLESGLMKMIAVGLGKHKGACALHVRRVPGLRNHMPEIARDVIQRGHILGGVGIVENGRGEIFRVAAMRATDIEPVERRLLRIAKRMAPRLPFDEMDMCIVDWMGKDISGVGMDPLLLGRMHLPGELPEPKRPRIRNVVALRLTPASHGNALGVGLAEFIPRVLAGAIDDRMMKANCMTSGFLERAKLPLVMDNDREAIESAAIVGQSRRVSDLRIVRVRDTTHVGEIWMSPALAADASTLGLDILGPARPMRFDASGNYLDISRH